MAVHESNAIVKVYRYGLLPPTEGDERIADQLSRAHRYKNDLVRIERERREAMAALFGCPIEAVFRAAKDAPQHADALAAITQEARAKAKALRGSCGVYWGTYLLIEQSMDAARRAIEPPRFQRWTGDGAVAVQIQHGIATAEVMQGDDTRLQIDQRLQLVPGRGGKPRPRVRLRIGSEGRDPIWGEWPLILHRPLPSEGRVKGAKVVRRRVCGRDEWSLHVTVELPAVERQAGDRVVAVDLGWRMEEERVRVAGLADGATTEEVYLDPGVAGMLRKASDIRSIRDKAQAAMHTALLTWKVAATLPPEHAEHMDRMSQWQSPARFAGLERWWRDHRIDGDAPAYDALALWRTQDRHLWLWETHARSKALARRRDRYRVLAARLASQYSTLVIERLVLTRLAQKLPDSNPRARSQRTQAAPSELRRALVQAFQSQGGTVVTVQPTGPAAALLLAYRERSGVEEMPGTARVSKFKRLAALKAEKDAAANTSAAPLA